MGKIVYTRGTTYYLTVNYTAPTYLGTKVFFTAKNTKYDSDATDATNAIFTPKTASMSGSSFPQSVTLKISPGDVAKQAVINFILNQVTEFNNRAALAAVTPPNPTLIS